MIRKSKLFVETEFLSLAQALEGIHRATMNSEVAPFADFKKVNKMIRSLLTRNKVDEELKTRIRESLAHANGLTFRSRLNELCNSFSQSLLDRMRINREEFVKKILAARNQFTHAGGPTKATTHMSPLEMFILNQKMRALLRGRFLRYVDIPESQITEVLVREATRYRE